MDVCKCPRRLVFYVPCVMSGCISLQLHERHRKVLFVSNNLGTESTTAKMYLGYDTEYNVVFAFNSYPTFSHFDWGSHQP